MRYEQLAVDKNTQVKQDQSSLKDGYRDSTLMIKELQTLREQN